MSTIGEVMTGLDWVKGVGPNFYYDGNKGSNHPHLHAMFKNSAATLNPGTHVRDMIDMLAFSDGIVGVNFIVNGQKVNNIDAAYNRAVNNGLLQNGDALDDELHRMLGIKLVR